jgi:hypothetical protein
LLGADSQGDSIYIPLTSVTQIVESSGDVTVRYYDGLGDGHTTELVMEDTYATDVLSEVNLIEI